jgi:hypothetical protein
VPQSVGIIIAAGESVVDDGAFNAFASEVKAAAAAAAAAAGSDARMTISAVTRTVLQYVLADFPGGKRSAAVAQLPCFSARLRPASGDNAASNDYEGIIAAAAAAAALSLSACMQAASPTHPLTTASRIMSAATSRVGNSHKLHPTSDIFLPPHFFTPNFLTSAQGLDVAIIELLPSLASQSHSCTTFHQLIREHAPEDDPSASLCLVAAAAAAAARCSGCVATAVGSVLLTPQPLSAAEMVALLCFDIEQQLRLKLGRDSLAKGSKSLQILSHAECASGDKSLRMFESIQQLAR